MSKGQSILEYASYYRRQIDYYKDNSKIITNQHATEDPKLDNPNWKSLEYASYYRRQEDDSKHNSKIIQDLLNLHSC